jgi:hypothetical protein
MAGYTRQSLAQILNGEIVSAPPLNAEFNQILSAFNNSTGHKHDGTTAEGPPIDRIADLDQNNLIFVDTGANQINFYIESSAASVGQISIQDGAIVPFTDNDIDLGSSSFEFKDLYIDGTANIDSLVADTADINAGTIDNTIIGATTPAAATFTTLNATGGGALTGTWSDLGTVTTVDINGGTIDGVVIGGTTAAAGTFSTLNATGGGALTGTWTDLGTVTTVDLNGGTVDNVVIGGAVAAAGTFTTISAGGAAVYPAVITAIGAAGEVISGNTTGSLATFSNAGAAAISLHGAATSSATVYFGTTGPSGNTKGRVVYDFSAEAMAFFTGNTERARIDSSGRFLLGTTSGSNLLTVAGTASISGALTASGGGALTGTWSDLGTVTTVDINGGTITGITDLAVADGGTGSSTAAGARTNLGVAIGSNVQAYDAGLNSIAGLVTAADRMIYTTASDTYAVATLTAAGRAILDDADAAAQRTTLGLGTIATQAASAVAITGGTADNVVIGGTTAAAGTFTTLNATGGGSLTGTWSDLGTVTTIDINGGTIDGVVIGSSAAAAATVTTLSAGGAAVYPGVITAIGAAGEVVAGNTTGSLATFSNAGAAAISLHGAAANSATVYFGTTGAGGNTVGRLAYDFSVGAMAFYTANTERARIDSSGNLLIGTTVAGASKLVVADDSIQINTAKTPASAAATGTTGEFAWDASYFYICTATNTWRRVAHATW